MRLFTTALLTLVLAGPAYAGDGTTFRGDAAHSGTYDGTGTTTFGGLKWKFHTGGYVNSTPAIENGIVYAGSTDGYLYAVSADTGSLRWKFATGSRVVSSPAIADGRVYFESYDGFFYALDAATGKARWKFKTGGEHRFEGTHLHGFLPVSETMPDVFDVFLSSPVVVDGDVYFGSGDGNVYALDAATGVLAWKFKTGDVVHASPAVVDRSVYIGSWDSYFYSLDAKSGKERWRFKTGVDPDIHNQVGIQSSAAVADGMVYFGCRDSHLYALDAATGRLRWSIPTHGSWVIASPAVDNGRLYFATSDTGLFYSVDARSGAVGFSLDFKHWPMFSSPAVAGDMAYIGSHNGRLIAIDTGRKSVAWTFATDGEKRYGATYTSADGTPNYEAAFPGSFYDDLVVGFSRLMTVGAVISSPVVVGDTLYFGSTDGALYALRIKSS